MSGHFEVSRGTAEELRALLGVLAGIESSLHEAHHAALRMLGIAALHVDRAIGALDRLELKHATVQEGGPPDAMDRR